MPVVDPRSLWITARLYSVRYALCVLLCLVSRVCSRVSYVLCSPESIYLFVVCGVANTARAQRYEYHAANRSKVWDHRCLEWRVCTSTNTCLTRLQFTAARQHTHTHTHTHSEIESDQSTFFLLLLNYFWWSPDAQTLLHTCFANSIGTYNLSVTCCLVYNLLYYMICGCIERVYHVGIRTKDEICTNVVHKQPCTRLAVAPVWRKRATCVRRFTFGNLLEDPMIIQSTSE